MSERILVLDDESSILEVLGELLGEAGYECRLTTSAIEALKILKEEKFALLITDLKMSEMHGIEVVRKAREADSDLAVIVVTAMLEITNAIEAMRMGADDYVLKPFNLSQISLSVEKALDRRRLIVESKCHQEELERRVKEATRELEGTNAELRNTKEYLENLLHSSVDAIVTVDNDAKVTFINHGAVDMLGYAPEEFLDEDVAKYFVGQQEELKHIRRLLSRDETLQNYETELVHKNGGQVPISMSISSVKDTSGTVVSILAICKDITEQKRLEAELKEMSIKDSLTGLYNQRYFYERLETEIERASRQGRPLSLLLLDVDEFKPYNDRHGHLEGDRVLKTVGHIILECTREHVDIGFRYGGDEFTVILPEADAPQANQIAERVREMFRAKRFDDLTLSIGLMAYKKGSSLKSFIRFTDAMMYDAKRSGGDKVHIFAHKAAAQKDGEAAAR